MKATEKPEAGGGDPRRTVASGGPRRTVVSASRRTDIPAFYARWFLRRVEEGFCEWVHPFGGGLRRISLRPEDCAGIVFWTRNPGPLVPALGDLRREGYVLYVHATITGYPRELDAYGPALDVALRRFREAAGILGPDAVTWRYDPIVVSSLTPRERHLAVFEEISRALEGATRSAYVSFVDLYGKTRSGFERLERSRGIRFVDPGTEERRELILRLRDLAARRGMTLFACCEDELAGEGVEKGRCVDAERLRALGADLPETYARRPSRPGCGCSESVDIGAYDTCAFGCAYCYATRSREIALERLREHDPADTLLWRPPALRALTTKPSRGGAEDGLSPPGFGSGPPRRGG